MGATTMPIRMPTSLPLLLLALTGQAVEVAGTAPPAPTAAPSPQASALTATESAAIDAAALALVEAGFPDPAGADLVIGTVRIGVPAPGDAAGTEDEPRVLGRSATLVEGRLVAPCVGAHLRCRDGAWILDGGVIWRPNAERSIAIDADATIQPASAWRGGDGTPDDDYRRRTREDSWLTDLPPAAVERREALRRAARPIDNLDSWSYTTDPLLLHRAGMPGAAERALLNAQVTAQPGWLSQRQAEPTLSIGRRFTATEEPPPPARHLDLVPPGPAAAVWVAGWLESLLDNQEFLAASGLDADTVVARLLARTDPTRRGAVEAVARLRLARLTVPAETTPDAPLAEHLRRWSPSQRDEDAWRPRPEHLPELLALLDDPSPALSMPEGWPRRLGDQALHALATLLRFDPRLAVGRDQRAPWTDNERLITATAVRAWIGGKTMAELPALILATVPGLPARSQWAVLGSRPAAERPALIAAITPGWAAPRADCDAWTLAGMLDLASATPAFATAIATWPPTTDRLGEVLAVWHDFRGAPQHLDARLAAADGSPDLVAAWEQAGRRPNAQRLARAVALLAQAPETAGWAPLAGALNLGSEPDPPAWRAAAGLDEPPEGELDAPLRLRHVLPLAALCLLLQDERPLPPGAARLRRDPGDDAAWLEVRCGGVSVGTGVPESVRDQPPPTDLRICDVALLACANLPGRQIPDTVALPLCRPWAAFAERRSDAAAASAALIALVRPTLDAARLPDILPALTPDHGPTAIF